MLACGVLYTMLLPATILLLQRPTVPCGSEHCVCDIEGSTSGSLWVVKGSCSKRCTSSRVEGSKNTPHPLDITKALVELGLVSIAVPSALYTDFFVRSSILLPVSIEDCPSTSAT